MIPKILFISLVLVTIVSVKAEDATTTAKEIISEQVALLKAADIQKFKTCFTERQKERITKESIKKGQREISNYTIDDLVASTVEGEYNGEKTIKIKMANGRTLTTLVFQNGKWLADTIWFR
ncbi:MAG: hypothetical protein KBA66_00850 [Leptospiraceae bacterium]|nr:hypothetical protein [Leptospiraceae bacterium]